MRYSAPGRRERLPAHAPLRTVRESFPSHGSSLSKVQLGRADPLFDGRWCILGVHRTPLGQLGNLVCGRLRCAPLKDSSRTHQATGVARHLHFPVWGGSAYCPAIQDLTDVGISGALHSGLGFFGLLHAAPATLPCGWGDHERRGPGWQRFHVLHSIRDGFRSALYTGSALFAPGYVRRPGPDCLPFWPEP